MEAKRCSPSPAEGVARACHIMARIQTILQPVLRPSATDQFSEIASGLLREAQLSITRALYLTSQDTTAAALANGSPAIDQKAQVLVDKRKKSDGIDDACHDHKRRKQQSPLVITTCAPYCDDQQRTMYQQKNANGYPGQYSQCPNYKEHVNIASIKTVQPMVQGSDTCLVSSPTSESNASMHSHPSPELSVEGNQDHEYHYAVDFHPSDLLLIYNLEEIAETMDYSTLSIITGTDP